MKRIDIIRPKVLKNEKESGAPPLNMGREPAYFTKADGEESDMPEVLKVSAQSKPKSVAGALAAVLRERGTAEVQAVGAGAVNQAVKAIAIARGYVAPNGIDLVAVPAFAEIDIEGEERTAIRFIVEPR